MDQELLGKLLIASPGLKDDRFQNGAVVLQQYEYSLVYRIGSFYRWGIYRIRRALHSVFQASTRISYYILAIIEISDRARLYNIRLSTQVYIYFYNIVIAKVLLPSVRV